MKMEQKNGNFIQKLDKLLKSSTFSDIISWDSSKTIIDVLDVQRMETQIIPKYFRHQKFESFVRQLNLYGFRKIKLQGRHRFTHPLLLSGQQLTSITSLKCLKNNKESKQNAQSPVLLQNGQQESQINELHMNSMENRRQQPLSQQRGVFIQIEPNGLQNMPANTIFMIPANYLNFWNFAQLATGQNMASLPIMTPFIPQK